MATNTTLEIILKAKDEASAKIQGLSEKAKAMSAGFAVAGGAITGALAFATKSAMEAEVQMSKVYATLQSMGRDTPQVRDAIQSMADATLELGFDNEEASVSIANLFQRTGDLTQAQKLNNLAMDLARAKSISLGEASSVIGQVLSGNGKVLKQYGINIKDSATPMQALTELQGKVSGQAKGYTTTLSGQIDIMKQKFGEISESVGSQLIPIFVQLLESVKPILDNIIKWIQANPELFKTIVLVTGSLGALLTVVGAIGLALGPLATFLGALSVPVLAVIGVVAGLVAIFWELNEIVKILQTDSEAVILGIKEYWKEFLNWINTKLLIPLKNFFKDTWEGIKVIVKDAIDSVIKFIQPALDAMDKVVKTVGKVKDKVGGAVGDVVDAWSNAGANVKYLFTGRATGGSVMAGTPYMVGEKGPELFTPFQSGTISPNRGGGGNAITININGGTYLSESVAKDIGDMIIQQFKRNVKL
jgi:phage-related minor tail protein